MRLRLLMAALRFVLSQVDAMTLKMMIDDLLDKVEDTQAGNPVAMQAVALARQTLSIPDDIGGDED